MKSSIPKEAGSHLRMISADELAAVLNLTVDSVYRLVRRGDIPAYRIGRTVRFDVAQVMAALSIGSGDSDIRHSDDLDKDDRRPAAVDRRRDDA